MHTMGPRAALLGGVVGSALVAQGSVLPREQLALALGIGVLAWVFPSAWGAPGPRALVGWGLLAGAIVLSGAGVPVPDLTSRHAGTAWALVVLAFSVAVYGLAPPRALWERGLAWAGVVWAAVGAAHAAVGAEAVFGLWAARPGLGAFFAPLVNPNHHGLVLWALLPFVVARAVDAKGLERGVLALCALWALVLPLVIRSMGLVVVASVVGAVALGWAPMRRRVRAGLISLGATAAGVGAAVLVRSQPEWWLLSGAPRWQQWTDAVTMVRAAPASGWGVGSYEAAYVRYRTVLDFARYEHAHSDVVEWVVETGGVGLVAGGLAVAIAWGPWTRTGRPWRLSVLALGVHAAVDFPLHVPGVALLAALLTTLALRDESRVPGNPRAVAGARMAVLAAGLAGAFSLHARDSVERLAQRALSGEATEAELAHLAQLAPDRAEVQVARLEAAPSVAAAQAVLHAPWPSGLLLARTAATLVKLGEPEQAQVALLRSLREQPNDYRTWRLLAVLKQEGGDPVGAADAWVECLRRWPRHLLDGEDPFATAFATLPLGSYWLKALSDAPAVWSVRLSRMMITKERYELAWSACRQAGRLRPAAHVRMPECAEALVGMGRHDEALAYVRAWTESAPSDVWAWAARARTARVSEEVSREEVDAVLTAQRLRPEHGAIKRLVSETQARVGACVIAGGCADVAHVLETAPVPAGP